jgi:hypothetical protein
MYFKNFFAGCFLLFTLVSVLATSYPRGGDRPSSGQHYIISDCVTPTRDGTVVISGSAIVSPGGVSFTDFGFPVATLEQTVSGTVGSATRECTVTYGEGGDFGKSKTKDRWLYSCFDNGKFKCSIYIEPN